MRRAAVAVIVGACSIVACAARVPPASVEEHQLWAQFAEDLAVAHDAQYDPKHTIPTIPCMEMCFNPWSNPTAVHHYEARRLWRVAQQHRQASLKLRVAEERACLDVPMSDRDVRSFFDCSSVAAIEMPLQDQDPFIVEFAVPDARVGAFRAATACHEARSEAHGQQMPELDFCPLAIAGAEVEMTSHEDGLRVELRSTDEWTRAEIRERLLALMDEQATPEDRRLDEPIITP